MWANNLRVFSAFAVVMLHVAAGFVGGIELSDLNYGNREWWAGNIYDSVTRWCVPLFVMISGYFLLNKDEPTSVFFKKRLNKILIPLIFWSVFFSFWT
ncbi:TPA: acyltransferase family protein, partial [Klebsiella variicola subsp. variicola]|nr:acyltransferase family protein [Klebsiella variicola subsp. variicola]